MVKALPDILATIVEQKKLDLAVRDARVEERAERSVTHRRDFLAALNGRTPAVIAEIRKASPSKGILTRLSSTRLPLRACTNKAARRRCRC